MRERLYLAGCPTTWPGWAGFGLAMLVGLVGTAMATHLPPAAVFLLLLVSWAVNLATVHWSASNRLICHLAAWIVLWRALVPDHPWYLVLLPSILLAGAVVWEQERRKQAG